MKNLEQLSPEVDGMGGGGGAGLGGGGGRGSNIDWVGGYWAQRRARLATYRAIEADLAERGLPIPERPMADRDGFWRGIACGFACGLLLGLLIGLIFWELT